MLEIAMSCASSLKDRRQVVQSLTARIRKHHDASAADLGPDHVWDRAVISAACVGSSKHEMDERVRAIVDTIDKMDHCGEYELIRSDTEVFEYGDVQDR